MSIPPSIDRLKHELRLVLMSFKSEKYDASYALYRVNLLIGNYNNRGFVFTSLGEIQGIISGERV